MFKQESPWRGVRLEQPMFKWELQLVELHHIELDVIVIGGMNVNTGIHVILIGVLQVPLVAEIKIHYTSLNSTQNFIQFFSFLFI